MQKILFLFLFLYAVLNARENPFSPLHLLPVQKVEVKVKEPQIETPKTITPKPLKKPKPIIKKLPIAKAIPIIKIQPKKVKKKPLLSKKKKSPLVKKSVSKKKVVKKYKKKRIRTQLLYANKFTQIKLHGRTITIKTKDTLLKEFTLKHPNRIVFDFERFDAIKTFSKKIRSKYIKNIKLGYHGYFYRVIFTLEKNKHYKLYKKPYGYAISIL